MPRPKGSKSTRRTPPRPAQNHAPESGWGPLSGTMSAHLAAGEHRPLAVKLIGDRGNQLLVVKKLKEGR